MIEATRLFFKEGSSDKEYRIQIEENGNGTYEVNAQWGRRGNACNSGCKGSGLSLSEAQEVYRKLMDSKIRKGYEESPYQSHKQSSSAQVTHTVTRQVCNNTQQPEKSILRVEPVPASRNLFTQDIKVTAIKWG